MSKVKLKPCPCCSPFEHDLEFVEISTRNFEHGIAVECLSCGCRSMAADAEDGEEMAASLWNDMSVANTARGSDVLRVKEAQDKLRATQINWQEQCLFDCDDILTEVIRKLGNAHT